MNKLIKLTNFKTSQKGMSFLEVLVALVIIVTGVLGAVAMQVTAKRASFDAMQRSLASGLAQDIISRIRANGVNNLASYAGTDYGVDVPDSLEQRCNAANIDCTSVQMVANDVFEWEQALSGADVKSSGDINNGGLVGGLGCISIDDNALKVVVSWQGREDTSDGKGSSGCGGTYTNKKRRQVVVEAFII